MKRAAAADAMGKAETLALARAMLRTARRFSDYNFRECVAASQAAALRGSSGQWHRAACGRRG